MPREGGTLTIDSGKMEVTPDHPNGGMASFVSDCAVEARSHPGIP